MNMDTHTVPCCTHTGINIIRVFIRVSRASSGGCIDRTEVSRIHCKAWKSCGAPRAHRRVEYGYCPGNYPGNASVLNLQPGKNLVMFRTTRLWRLS